jgi:ABC-type Mn2+/Zn2+ transport system permease subunit
MSDLLREFLESFELFWTTYVTGLCAAAVLAFAGVFALAQRQLFTGVATAQASTLGIAFALAWLGLADDHHHLHGWPLVFGVGFAVAANLACSRLALRATVKEGLSVAIFVAGGCLPILLLAHGPKGLEEVERLTFSTLIGSDIHDIQKIGALLLATIVLLARHGRALLFAALEPETAIAMGIAPAGTTLAFPILFGLALGLCLHTAGSVFCIAALTMPALFARRVHRTAVAVLWTAPLYALIATLIGFALANHYDLPIGTTAAATMLGQTALAHLLPRR